MPLVLDLADDAVSSLDECVDALRASGFRPREDESLHHAALQLRRLGNNPTFLGDRIVEELARRHREEEEGNSYGAAVLMLAPSGGADFFMRANIWPSADEHAVRASSEDSFVYEMPHDHNFSFLTIGYFGPGYWSSYYEYDYEAVAGWSGEPVDLRFVERSRLEPGKIQLYRAHLDVHAQHLPDAMSVSLNVMQTSASVGWLDQYRFDTGAGRVTRIVSHGASEAFVRIAAGMRHAEGLDLAERFALNHPSDRMRLACFGALASAAEDADEVWRRAETSGSRLVAMEARARRAALVG